MQKKQNGQSPTKEEVRAEARKKKTKGDESDPSNQVSMYEEAYTCPELSVLIVEAVK